MSRYRQTMSELLKQVRESKQKPYVSMSSGGQYNVLDKDGKTAYSTKDQRLAQDYFKKNYDKLKEQDDKDHEVSMARGELEAIADKATQLASMLKDKSDEGNPLEAWVQSKITKAKDYINSVSDYLMYNPDMKQNEEIEEGRKTFRSQSNIGQAKYVVNFHDGKKKHNDGSDFFDMKIFNNKIDRDKFIQSLKQQGYIEEATELEEGFSSSLKQKAKELAKKFANNMTKAVDEIEKLAKGLSDEPEVYKVIRQYNEDLEEGKIKDIFTANKEGESIEQIAKRLNISIATVKKLLGEAKDDKEVPKGYHKMPDGSIMKDSEHKKDDKKEDVTKEKEVASKDKEIETLKNQNALLKQKIENEKNKAVKPEPNPKTGEVPLTIGIAHAEFKKKKEEVKEETLDEFTSSMIKDLQKSYADLKGKTLSPEKATALSKHLDRIDLVSLKQLVKANIPFVSTLAKNKIYKKTGKFEELNLENTSAFNPSVHNKTLGVITKDLDRAFKKLSNQAQSYVNELLRTGMGTRDAIKKAKQRFNEDRRLYVEGIAGLQKKADKSGMPYSILKQVYDRGMAAWKSGHRPGASQQQWAFARVNSFITKSSGTWGGADKDLAAKVKGEK